MHDRGAAFRNRYIYPSGYDEYVGTVGIEPHHINNAQLHVESSTEHYSSASAIAFMHGLYPPVPHVTYDSIIPSDQWLFDGSQSDYSLFGYQNPNVKTLAPGSDPDSIWYCDCARYASRLYR